LAALYNQHGRLIHAGFAAKPHFSPWEAARVKWLSSVQASPAARPWPCKPVIGCPAEFTATPSYPENLGEGVHEVSPNRLTCFMPSAKEKWATSEAVKFFQNH
jgi:hypothetical protein